LPILESLNQLTQEAVSLLKEHPELSCYLTFSWAFLETAFLIGIILPAEKVLVFSSVLAAEGVISPLSFVLCGFFGTFLGYTLSYAAGFYLGEELLKKVARRLKVEESEIERARLFVERRGEVALIFGRFIPVVRALLPFIIAAFRPSFLKFSLFNAVGALLWVLSYLLLGNLIAILFSFIISHKLLAFATLLAVSLAYFFWRRYGKNRKVLS